MTEQTVPERDAETIKHLTVAEQAILDALRSMPNSVQSGFDPANDVPALEGALRRVRDTIRFHDPKRGT